MKRSRAFLSSGDRRDSGPLRGLKLDREQPMTTAPVLLPVQVLGRRRAIAAAFTILVGGAVGACHLFTPSTQRATTAAVQPPAPPPPPAEPPAAPRRPAVQEFQEIADLKDIHFDFDKSDIGPDAARTLDASAAWIKTNANNLILIEGHCDER